jgi:hypothetical protein
MKELLEVEGEVALEGKNNGGIGKGMLFACLDGKKMKGIGKGCL